MRNLIVDSDSNNHGLKSFDCACKLHYTSCVMCDLETSAEGRSRFNIEYTRNEDRYASSGTGAMWLVKRESRIRGSRACLVGSRISAEYGRLMRSVACPTRHWLTSVTIHPSSASIQFASPIHTTSTSHTYSCDQRLDNLICSSVTDDTLISTDAHCPAEGGHMCLKALFALRSKGEAGCLPQPLNQ